MLDNICFYMILLDYIFLIVKPWNLIKNLNWNFFCLCHDNLKILEKIHVPLLFQLYFPDIEL